MTVIPPGFDELATKYLPVGVFLGERYHPIEVLPDLQRPVVIVPKMGSDVAHHQVNGFHDEFVPEAQHGDPGFLHQPVSPVVLCSRQFAIMGGAICLNCEFRGVEVEVQRPRKHVGQVNRLLTLVVDYVADSPLHNLKCETELGFRPGGKTLPPLRHLLHHVLSIQRDFALIGNSDLIHRAAIVPLQCTGRAKLFIGQCDLLSKIAGRADASNRLRGLPFKCSALAQRHPERDPSLESTAAWARLPVADQPEGFDLWRSFRHVLEPAVDEVQRYFPARQLPQSAAS